MEASESGTKPGTFVFAPFTFEVESGELARNRRRLRIPQQTSILLTVLLERAGSVVSRDELRQLLWPNGEFLDYDHAINRAVNNLRLTLRDDPKKPQFIETLPKRGYRFRGEVTFIPQVTTNLRVSPVVSPERVPAVPELVEAGSTAVPPNNPRWSRLSRAARSMVSPLWLSLAGAMVLMAVALVAWTSTRETAHAGVIRMGILPFEVEGPGAEQLAESFRLDLLDTMAQLPNVEIHAAHSLARVKRDDPGLHDIAATLHLDVLLVGRLSLEDKRVLLQMELVRGSNVAHIASLQYASSQDELQKVRTRVQRDVFANLQVTGKPLQTVKGSTQDPQAYTLYLQARDSISRGTEAASNRGIELYQAAIDRDSNFAQAYSGIATAHLGLSDYPNGFAHLSQARQFAQQALKLDPQRAEAHAVLGAVAYRMDWNQAQAEGELRRAVALEPHQAVYHGWLAEILASTGRFEEGLEEVDRARADDPLWPMVYYIDVLVSGLARQHARMIDAGKAYVRLFPENSNAHDLLAWSYFSAGRYKEAIEEWRTMASMEKDSDRVKLEDEGLAVFQKDGIKGFAALRVKAIRVGDPGTKRHPNDFVPAEWYAFTGDARRALSEIQGIVDRHENDALDLAVNPMFDNLHRDPRFVALLSRVGLTLPNSYPKPSLQAQLR